MGSQGRVLSRTWFNLCFKGLPPAVVLIKYSREEREEARRQGRRNNGRLGQGREEGNNRKYWEEHTEFAEG